MQAGKNFRFRLKNGAAAYRTVKPHPYSDWKLSQVGDKDEMYFRNKFSGTLVFWGEDYDEIKAAAFDTEFRVLIQEQVGTTFQSKSPVLKFYKTDCEFDDDAKRVKVSPSNVDAYEEILNGLQKEFNLIELEPPTVTVKYRKQGIFQVYLPSSEYIMNYSDGFFWESPVTPFNITPAEGESTTDTNHEAMLNDYGFGLGTGFTTPGDGQFNYARVVIPGNNLNPDVAGVYRCTLYQSNGYASLRFDREDGLYRIENDGTVSVGNTRILITRVSDSAVMYRTSIMPSPYSPFGIPPHLNPTLEFESLTDPAKHCEGYLFLPYVRLLTTKTTIGGDATVLLPDDDPFNKGVFTHALPIDTLNFTFSDGHSTSPTRWGKFSTDALFFGGQYFVKPTSSTVRYMPLLPTGWTGASAWFYPDATLRDLQNEAGTDVEQKDGYKLSDVLATLLDAVGTTASHADGASWSSFLYAASNAIRGSRLVPIIIPKSNVLIGEYEQPAKKALIRLADVLQLVRDFYHAFWHVSGENRFVVEHYQYYHNGASYAGPNVGASLVGLVNPQASRSWAYGTNKWRYEKQELPERYQFKWMDSVSKPFDGYPIEVRSAYVQKGNIEERQSAKFTSDLDYLHVAPDTISKDGFVFLECEEETGYYQVPFVDIEITPDETYRLQNGYASYVYAHDKYWRHGLPATDVTINGQDATALSVLRTRAQELEQVPPIASFDPYELVETQLGNGRIESSELNLESGFRKVVIRLDNE